MKRKLLIFGMPALAVALVAGIGIASAASPTTGTTTTTGTGTTGGARGPMGRGGPGGFGDESGGMSAISPSEYATNQATQFQNEASALGLSESVIINGWANGENLMQIATANGITTTTLQSDMKTYQQSQLTAQLQALVINGTITQAQMNTRLALEEQQMSQTPVDDGNGPQAPPADANAAATQ